MAHIIDQVLRTGEKNITRNLALKLGIVVPSQAEVKLTLEAGNVRLDNKVLKKAIVVKVGYFNTAAEAMETYRLYTKINPIANPTAPLANVINLKNLTEIVKQEATTFIEEFCKEKAWDIQWKGEDANYKGGNDLAVAWVASSSDNEI